MGKYIAHEQSVSQNKVGLHMQGIGMQVCLKCTLIVDNKLCWKNKGICGGSLVELCLENLSSKQEAYIWNRV